MIVAPPTHGGHGHAITNWVFIKIIIIFIDNILLRLHSLVLLLAIAGFTYYLIRVTGELPLVLEVEEVAADLLFADPVGWYVDVAGELPNGARLGGALRSDRPTQPGIRRRDEALGRRGEEGADPARAGMARKATRAEEAARRRKVPPQARLTGLTVLTVVLAVREVTA
jgi:hypothetical protein